MANFSTDDEDQQVTVHLPADTGEGTEDVQVYPPTPEQLLLFSAAIGDPQQTAVAVLELLEDIFEPADFARIRKRLRARRGDPARLRLEQLTAVIEEVVAARSDFPTQQPSDSSPTPPSTGRRSTGRVHSPASTPAASVRAAS